MAFSDAFYNEMAGVVIELVLEFGTTYEVRKTGVYDKTTMQTTYGTSRNVAGLIVTKEMVEGDEILRSVGRKI